MSFVLFLYERSRCRRWGSNSYNVPASSGSCVQRKQRISLSTCLRLCPCEFEHLLLGSFCRFFTSLKLQQPESASHLDRPFYKRLSDVLLFLQQRGHRCVLGPAACPPLHFNNPLGELLCYVKRTRRHFFRGAVRHLR